MDLSKMTNYALVLMSTRDPDGDMRKHTINELARRLEAAEALNVTYWAECKAWRQKFGRSVHVGVQGRECRLCGRLGLDTQPQRHSSGCPFVATDAAREVRSE